MTNFVQSPTKQQLLNFERKNLLMFLSKEIYKEKNKRYLWEFIRHNFKVKIHRNKICKDHNAPYDFVYDAFIGKYKTIIAKANRSGGKTTDFAILDIIHSLANLSCETATLGAIQAQAQRCYRYVQSYLQNNKEFQSRVTNSIMSRTDFDTRSSIEILTATVTGVNSPHPQKLFMDEVELLNWFVLQQALEMVKSKGDIKGQVVLGSTQKFVGGVMERLINDARNSSTKGYYEWCVWEVMEKPLPDKYEYYKKIFKDDLPENFTECDGFYSWDDLIEQYQNLDREILDAEFFCKKPDAGGLVYPRFTDENNCIQDFEFNKDNLYVFEDYGYGMDNPNVILFAQVDLKLQKIIIFDKIYLRLKTEKKIFAELDLKLKQYDIVSKRYQGHIGDPHGLPETANRYNNGYPILPAVSKEEIEDASKLYLVRNGIVAVRKFVDMGWLKFTPNCTQFRAEMMGYRKVKNPDGTYKDEPMKKNDHGCDAVRYGVIRLFPTMAFASFEVLRARANVPDSIGPAIRPITAGIRTQRF